MHASSDRAQAICGCQIFADGGFQTDKAVLLRGGTILDIVSRGAIPAAFETIELDPDTVLAPGFIDCQVNGGGGVLLNDEPTLEGITAIAEAHRDYGTTSLLPTLITDSPSKLQELAEIGSLVPGMLGLHIEGPFINPLRKAVHRADFIRPIEPADLELLRRFASMGRSLVTLAPECVDESVIADLRNAGLLISIGHSDATAKQARKGAERGASGVTHLFNAMSQMTPREPGVIGAAFDDERLTASIIVDGLHVDPTNVRVAVRQMGVDRLMLVSDAMPLVGTSASTFALMGRTVTLADDRLLTTDGTLAGAHLTMIDAVRCAVTIVGLSMGQALTMASATPAAFLGISHRLGAIRAGYDANLVAFDRAYQVVATWLGGKAKWNERPKQNCAAKQSTPTVVLAETVPDKPEITVNRRKMTAPGRKVTGAAIAALIGVPADNAVIELETNSGELVEMPLDTAFEINTGQSFLVTRQFVMGGIARED